MTEKIKKNVKQNVADISAKILVFRSNIYIYAQVIDLSTGNVLATASSRDIKKKMKKIEIALETGKLLGKSIADKKYKSIYFDRNGYRYHGRVKALAEGVRSEGIKF